MTILMTPTGGSTDAPPLEWCGRCDRTTDACVCDTDRAAPEPAPPVAPPAPAGRAADTPPVAHRSPVDRSPTEPVESRSTDTKATKDKLKSLGWVGRIGVCVLVLLALILGAVGFAISFETVVDAMRPEFHEMAWLVPTGVDAGILVTSGIILLLAWFELAAPVWLRFIPWGLTAVTVILNVTATTDPVFQVAHAALPLLWVVVSEIVTHVVKQLAGLHSGTDHRRSIPAMRWALAPIATFRLWRVMRLWDITTYTAALASERTRLMARTAMQTRYGSVPAAPAEMRTLYRLRQLDAAKVYAWRDRLSTGGTRSGATETDRPTPAPKRPTAAAKATGRTVTVSTGPKRPVVSKAADRPPAADRLAVAFADFRSRGIDPTGTELAAAAETSKTTANDWKKQFGQS